MFANPRNDKLKKLIRAYAREEAAKLVEQVIQGAVNYDYWRRERPNYREGVHHRSLELLKREAEKIKDNAWMSIDEAEREFEE